MLTFNIENEAISGFVHNETYADGYGIGTGTTKVKPYLKYVKEESMYDYNPGYTEQPNPVVIPTTAVVNGQSASTSFNFYNLLPNKEYSCKTDNGNVITFKTEGQERLVKCNRVFNVRDLGGWKCYDGRSIAYGKLFRCANLDGLSASTLDGYSDAVYQMTKVVGITEEIDLASDTHNHTNKSYFGVTYKGSVYSSGKYVKNDYAICAYSNFHTSNLTQMKNVFTAILSELKNGGAVLYHCWAGADRTGTLSALLLGLCGATEDAIIKDWELSSFVCYLNTKYIQDEDGLRTVFKTLYNNFGGTSGATLQQQITNYFLTKVKVTQAQIDEFKSLMIIGEEPQPEPEPEPTPIVTSDTLVIEYVSGTTYSITESGVTTYGTANNNSGLNAKGYWIRDTDSMVTVFFTISKYNTFKAENTCANKYCVSFYNSSKGGLTSFTSDENGNCSGTVPHTSANATNAKFSKFLLAKNNKSKITFYK